MAETHKSPAYRAWMKKWLLYRGVGTLLWIGLVWWPSISEILPGSLLSSLSDPDFTFAYIAAGIVVVVMLFLFLKLETIAYLAYLSVWFPLVVVPALCIYYVGWLGFRLLMLARRGVAPIGAVPCTAVMILGWLFLPRINDVTILKVMSVPWVVATGLSLAAGSLFALRPLLPIAVAVEKIEDIWSGFISKQVQRVVSEAADSQRYKKFQETSDQIKQYLSLSQLLETALLPRLKDGRGRNLSLLVFVAIFGCLTTAVISTYATFYMIVSRVNPLSLGGSGMRGGPMSVGEAFYLSVSILTTAGISPVEASSVFAKWVTAGEALTGFALITLLILAFSLGFERDVTWFETRFDAIVSRSKNHIDQWSTSLQSILKKATDPK